MSLKKWNPIGFTAWPVAFFTVLVYSLLFTTLLITHHVVPKAPQDPLPTQYRGINLTEAWHDLQVLTDAYHPYNSHRNDHVRAWLLRRVNHILTTNRALDPSASLHQDPPAIVFDDLSSNLTFGYSETKLGIAFTGTNIIVYIRGKNDEPGPFWTSQNYPTKSGVLINAHYDSVPSSYGATDDGLGVVTILQLISHFSHPDNTPTRGIVALLNNGEENFLNGAYAFSQHPLSNFPHTFLNLEGAGAGGRAAMFRSTDSQVTRFYQNSPNPFGTVLSADGFKHGLIRSETDYVIFNGRLGMRGLDIAFIGPRSKYHTRKDSQKFTSIDSLWHMLSASHATIKAMTSDTSQEFDGPPAAHGMVPAGKGSDAVWFDVLGRVFVIFELHTLFAISVAMLVLTPLFFIALTTLLVKLDKFYPFSSAKHLDSPHTHIPLRAWKGFSRALIFLSISTGATVALALLTIKMNPFIIVSSPYSVWASFLSAWFIVTWFFLHGSHDMRPSALQRFYTHMWLYVFSYLLLILVTILQDHFHIAGLYFAIAFFAAVFCSFSISYLELFALPKKETYARLVEACSDESGDAAPRSPAASSPQDDPERISVDESHNEASNNDDNERTALLSPKRTSFARGYGTHHNRPSLTAQSMPDPDNEIYKTLSRPYKREQTWSGSLPSSTWILQFLILAPTSILFVGPVALYHTTATHQTSSDGMSVLPTYMVTVLLSVFLLLPLAPFIHRLTMLLPCILFFICVGTTFYNLTAFPFSEQSPLKVDFKQIIDLDNGSNTASLSAIPAYVEQVVSYIPSRNGQKMNCLEPGKSYRRDLKTCMWEGLQPNVLLDLGTSTSLLLPPSDKTGNHSYRSWMDLSTARDQQNRTIATFKISGKNTRNCVLNFNKPVTYYEVQDFATDPRFPILGSPWVTSAQQPDETPLLRQWTRGWAGEASTNSANVSSESSGRIQTVKDVSSSSLSSSSTSSSSPWYKNSVGITSLRLWSREFGGSWTVTVEWMPSNRLHRPKKPSNDSKVERGDSDDKGEDEDTLTGFASCMWADANDPRAIPAFREVLHYLPKWAAASNLGDGLVEGRRNFAV